MPRHSHHPKCRIFQEPLATRRLDDCNCTGDSFLPLLEDVQVELARRLTQIKALEERIEELEARLTRPFTREMMIDTVMNSLDRTRPQSARWQLQVRAAAIVDDLEKSVTGMESDEVTRLRQELADKRPLGIANL